MRAYHLYIRHRTLFCVCGIPVNYSITPHPALVRLFAHESRACAIPFSPSVPPLFTEPRLRLPGAKNVLAALSLAELDEGVCLYTEEDFPNSVFLLVDTLDGRSNAHAGEFTLPANRESQLLAPYHCTQGGAALGAVVLHPGDSFLVRTTAGATRSVHFTKDLKWQTTPLAQEESLLFSTTQAALPNWRS